MIPDNRANTILNQAAPVVISGRLVVLASLVQGPARREKLASACIVFTLCVALLGLTFLSNLGVFGFEVSREALERTRVSHGQIVVYQTNAVQRRTLAS